MFKSIATKTLLELMERGLVPVSQTRKCIRLLLKRRLSELVAAEKKQLSRTRMVEVCDRSSIAPVPDKANEQHYEVPAEFYRHVLGPRFKYSCCFFNDGDSIEQAESNALAMTCSNAGIEDGQDILELGCGWGSLSLWMAEQYPNSNIVSVSNSHSQRRFIESRARQLGFEDRLKVITCDMNEFEIANRFDRVVSIEMFEHMRNYRELLSRIEQWLKPDGKLFIHIFVHEKYAYEFETKGSHNWMGRHFFSGGIMPTVDLLKSFNEKLIVREEWSWDGTHYAKTCKNWIETMKTNHVEIKKILNPIYGKETRRWWNRWLLFFEAGAELFDYENGKQWKIAHLLFERTDNLSNDHEYVDRETVAN